MRNLSKLLTLFILLGVAAVLTQCNDKEPPPFEISSVQEYLDMNDPATETRSFDAANGIDFTTKKGTKVSLKPDIFMDKDGNLAKGTIDFRIKEVFTNLDMIGSGVFPIASSNVLNCGGEFFTSASSNGEELYVVNGEYMDIEIPAQAQDNNMEIFLADGDEDVDTANWEEQPDTVGQRGFSGSFLFSSADNSYQIKMDSTGWGNIDAFDWSITYFDCKFNLVGKTGLNSTNTKAYAVFKGQNAVWPMGVQGWGDITNNQINETHLGGVGMNILVISVQDKQLYYGLLDVFPVQGTIYSIQMKPTTDSDLDDIINGLP